MSVYYVSNSGLDANSGRSPSLPWQTLAKVADFTFRPGDTVLLECGGEWYEQLVIKGDRTLGKPVTVGNYGSGKLPKISQHKISKSDSWVAAGTNLWSIDLADVAKFDGYQAVDDNAKNVGHLNIDGQIYGQRRWTAGDLAAAGEFHCAYSGGHTGVMTLYWPTNPGAGVKIAVGLAMIGQVFGVRVGGVELVGCAGHAFASAARDLGISGCWSHEIGGRYLPSAPAANTRAGNAFQVGYSSKRVYVHHNVISDCYDVACTMQGNAANATLSGWEDVQFHSNIVYRCEQAFETYANNTSTTGTGGVGTANVALGLLTGVTITTAGSGYVDSQQVGIVSRVGDLVATATGTVNVLAGGILSLAVTGGALGPYTNGETVDLVPLTWARDSTKGFIRTAFRDNICFDIGYGWGHDVRPDQDVASPILYYSMDAGTNEIDTSGNKFANFRGPLITSGSDDPLAGLVSTGYKVNKNFLLMRGDQELCNLLSTAAADYDEWAAESGFDGTDQVHIVSEGVENVVDVAMRRLADATANGFADVNVGRTGTLSLAADIVKLFGLVDGMDFPPVLGSSDPTGTARYIGEMFVNTTALTLHYAINTSGGASSWRRLINVVESGSAPSAAPPFIGRIYVDTSLGIAHLAKGNSSVSDWLHLSSFLSTPPSTATSTGRAGQWSADASWLYVCYSTNTWMRVAIATW